MAQLHLRLRPSQRRGAAKGVHVVVAVRKVDDVLARRGGQSPERHTYCCSARNLHPAAKAENGIENRTGAVGKRPAIRDRGGVLDRLTAAEKACAIRFKLYVAGAFAFHD